MATKSKSKYIVEVSSIPMRDSIAELILLMKSVVTAQLNQSNPGQAYLLVDFARSMNVVWNALSNVAVEALTEYAAQMTQSFDVDRFKDTLHEKVSLRKSVAATCPPKIESDVPWVPPMADVAMKTLKRTMGQHAHLMAQPKANMKEMKNKIKFDVCNLFSGSGSVETPIIGVSCCIKIPHNIVNTNW